ncbi:tho2 protein [Coprinopsis cinerea AmutBmut pab1-1]|nr:tho2 protein [Coprinopsis cinerea AmutBmut pab1-1]
MAFQESDKALAFRRWFEGNGGRLHKDVVYIEAGSKDGHGLIASQDIPADQEIVSCPVGLVVTPESARAAITGLLDLPDTLSWNSRQWISTYLALHWIVDHKELAKTTLIHGPYVNILPPSEQLSTSTYFTPEELERFKGTNLYGATLDRLREWQSEWKQCQNIVSEKKQGWGRKFEWSLYLKSATYISSRSFPSTLLSRNPSLPGLASDDETESILLPAIDFLNHARGQRVSWIANQTQEDGKSVSSISLIAHSAIWTGQEVFNNYGPKPNSELILSYGFSIQDNPDDSIILKLGGTDGRKWIIGRNATGVDGLWKEVLEKVSGEEYAHAAGDYEAVLDASGMLQDMVKMSLEKLPGLEEPNLADSVRPHVASMLRDYVQGQRAILESILGFAETKEQEGLDLAKEAGVELVFEDGPED